MKCRFFQLYKRMKSGNHTLVLVHFLRNFCSHSDFLFLCSVSYITGFHKERLTFIQKNHSETKSDLRIEAMISNTNSY